MTAKRKVSTTPPEKTVPTHKTRATIVLPPSPEWTEAEIDQRWEQIRVRGEQISADIKALRARIAS